jgi:L-asparaginase
MKLIIHGGFSESSTSLETKVAKQTLEQIVKDSYDYLKTHSALETVVLQCHYSKTMNCLMQDWVQIQSDGKIRMSAAIMDGNPKNEWSY